MLLCWKLVGVNSIHQNFFIYFYFLPFYYFQSLFFLANFWTKCRKEQTKRNKEKERKKKKFRDFPCSPFVRLFIRSLVFVLVLGLAYTYIYYNINTHARNTNNQSIKIVSVTYNAAIYFIWFSSMEWNRLHAVKTHTFAIPMNKCFTFNKIAVACLCLCTVKWAFETQEWTLLIVTWPIVYIKNHFRWYSTVGHFMLLKFSHWFYLSLALHRIHIYLRIISVAESREYYYYYTYFDSVSNEEYTYTWLFPFRTQRKTQRKIKINGKKNRQVVFLSKYFFLFILYCIVCNSQRLIIMMWHHFRRLKCSHSLCELKIEVKIALETECLHNHAQTTAYVKSTRIINTAIHVIHVIHV